MGLPDCDIEMEFLVLWFLDRFPAAMACKGGDAKRDSESGGNSDVWGGDAAKDGVGDVERRVSVAPNRGEF
jgi:hypothetical protein